MGMLWGFSFITTRYRITGHERFNNISQPTLTFLCYKGSPLSGYYIRCLCLYTVHVVYSQHCIVYTVQLVYSLHCIVYTVHLVYSLNCILYSLCKGNQVVYSVYKASFYCTAVNIAHFTYSLQCEFYSQSTFY